MVPSNRGISISIIGAICEHSVIDLTSRKPKPKPVAKGQPRVERRKEKEMAVLWKKMSRKLTEE